MDVEEGGGGLAAGRPSRAFDFSVEGRWRGGGSHCLDKASSPSSPQSACLSAQTQTGVDRKEEMEDEPLMLL